MFQKKKKEKFAKKNRQSLTCGSYVIKFNVLAKIAQKDQTDQIPKKST